jgi:CRP-like cAMP-binding protein
LLAVAVQRRFDPGRVLLREGDRSDHVELLLRGFVKVTTVVEGVEALLAIRIPGDIVGELAPLTNRPRGATVTACGRVTSSVVQQADFRRFLHQHPAAAVSMAAAIAGQLRWANLRRTDSAAYPAEVRVARTLVDLAEVCGRRTPEGITMVVPLSQSELATMVGIAEATVQKAVRELRRNGLIRTGYRRLTILDLEALGALGDGSG